MKSKGLFFDMLFIALSGCAAYELPPLDLNHPANARAMAAPAQPLSKTLVYSRADMQALSAAETPQSGQESHQPATQSTGQKNVLGEGKVIATVPSANQLVIEHGEITGFMDAMTMGYRVEPPSLLEGLKPGDQVRFTIDVPNKMIVKLKKMN
jgi:Cu/Ag efflux protein CusF